MTLILPLTPAATEFWDKIQIVKLPLPCTLLSVVVLDFITRENNKWKFLTNYLLLFRLKAALKDLQLIPSNTTGFFSHCSFDN